MIRPIHVITILIWGLVAWIFLSHLNPVEYIVNKETNDSYLVLYDGNVTISSRIEREKDNSLSVNLHFYKPKTEISIDDIKIKLNDLNLRNIEAFNGMNPEENNYEDFDQIPNYLKKFSVSEKGYYAFNYVFEFDKFGDDFTLNYSISFAEKGLKKEILNTLEFKRIVKTEFKVAHGDISVLLIPIFGLIGLILTIIILVRIFRNKNKSA